MPVQPMWLQNLDYPARWDRTVFDNVWENEGIIDSGSLLVSPQAIPNMTVQVAAGVAVVQGDDQAFQGKYLCREEAVTASLAISAAPGSGTRYDLVVLRVNDPNAGGAAGDNAVLAVVTGVASGSPVDPAVPPSALVLARVVVASGTGSIQAANIVDLRTTARLKNATAPVGTVQMFAGSVVPSGWLLCDGTAVSQTTYVELYATIAGTYNTSGGQSVPAAGLFRVPLLTGRVPVGRNASDTNFDVLGETGGASTHTLSSAEMPTHTHVQDAHNHIQDAHNHTQNSHNHTQDPHNHAQNSHIHSQAAHSHLLNATFISPAGTHAHDNLYDYVSTGTNGAPIVGSNLPNAVQTGGSAIGAETATNIATTATNQTTTPTNNATTATNQATTATNQNTGGGSAHNNLQPYIVLNFIIKT